ncbi:MAG TPA: hypothetical protein VGD58_11445 [Herpetosiphonaceae bacterium]
MSTSTYLAAYLAGEHERVVQELLAFGPAIREEPIAGDAQAVVREMMRRAHHNIGLIVERLRTLGYRFVSDLPRREFNPAQIVERTIVQAQEQLGFQVPPELKAQLDRLAAHAAQQYPLIVEDFKQQAAQWRAEQGLPDPASSPPVDPIWRQPDAELSAQVAAIQERYGPLPLVLEAWFAIVGEVDLRGIHPQLSRYVEDESEAEQGPFGCPLFVACFSSAEELAALAEDEETPPDRVEIAPDECHKSGYSGGAALALPLPTAALDARLISDDQWNGMYFVDYLRLAFRYGGFPGLHDDARARDAAQAELALLTEGLLPL